MIHTIECQFNAQPGTIERILRVVRVRGFAVVEMQAGLVEQGSSEIAMNMTLTLNGVRCVSNLVQQLHKLCDVTGAEVKEMVDAIADRKSA